MGSHFSKEDEYRISKKLVFENIRRVFFASALCTVIMPILMLIYKNSDAPFSGTIRGALIFYEVLSVLTIGMSYVAMRLRDMSLSKVMYRTYWLIFECFSFLIIYSDKLNRSNFSFYSLMALGLFIIPAMEFTEQIYYVVLLAVYTVFMSIKFSIGAMEIFNLAATVVALYAVSRFLHAKLVESIVLKEHIKEVADNEPIDSLTGLLNRTGIEMHVQNSMQSNIAARKRVSLLMIDIDDMNKYNDSYGVEHGDECIRMVASVVRNVALRSTESICRLDGGRFLVYIDGSNEGEGVSIAERIRTQIESKRIPHGRRASNNFVTVSVGMASCVPRSKNDFSELYADAEDALYEAKNQGRNVTVYGDRVYGAYKKTAAY